MASLLDGFKPHSHISMTFHPDFFNCFLFRRSRLRLASILASQNALFVLGIDAREQPLCPCQKQPCMKMHVAYFFMTTSGLPGRSFWWRRYRNPFENKNFLTSSSGLVFLPRMLDMISLLFSGLKMSLMPFTFNLCLTLAMTMC